MRILLTDGSGLTSRQVATQAARAGHTVDALSPTRLGLAGLTRHVRALHPVPRFGEDPYAWLTSALAVLRRGDHDVLLATHEQASILSAERAAVAETGVAIAVPPFGSLLRVQDKASQSRTLTELGIPQPRSRLGTSIADALDEVGLPVYVKAPVGTASATVRFAADRDQLERAARELAPDGGELIVQEALAGPVLMVQAVFDEGRLVAWHANLRIREGPNGGSSMKASVRPAVVDDHLVALGEGLAWHGALSLDAVLTADGPRYIDVNPRLVEPGNAWRAGTDLVEALIAVSRGELVPPQAPPREDVMTHQLLLAVLAAAGAGRRAVLGELYRSVLGRPPYAGSLEELTPRGGDALAWVPVAAAAAVTLVSPATRRWFTEGAVAAYALTPGAWEQINNKERSASHADG